MNALDAFMSENVSTTVSRGTIDVKGNVYMVTKYTGINDLYQISLIKSNCQWRDTIFMKYSDMPMHLYIKRIEKDIDSGPRALDRIMRMINEFVVHVFGSIDIYLFDASVLEDPITCDTTTTIIPCLICKGISIYGKYGAEHVLNYVIPSTIDFTVFFDMIGSNIIGETSLREKVNELFIKRRDIGLTETFFANLTDTNHKIKLTFTHRYIDAMDDDSLLFLVANDIAIKYDNNTLSICTIIPRLLVETKSTIDIYYRNLEHFIIQHASYLVIPAGSFKHF